MDDEHINQIKDKLFEIAKDYYKSDSDTMKKGVFRGARRVADLVLTKEEMMEICWCALEECE